MLKSQWLKLRRIPLGVPAVNLFQDALDNTMICSNGCLVDTGKDSKSIKCYLRDIPIPVSKLSFSQKMCLMYACSAIITKSYDFYIIYSFILISGVNRILPSVVLWSRQRWPQIRACTQ